MSGSSEDDPIETAWRVLLESQWDHDEKHQAFVMLATALSRLPDAAACYRSVESDPARHERAEAGKQLVLKSALSMLSALPHSSTDDARQRARWLVPLATLGMLIAADFALAALMHQRSFVSIPAFVLEILVVVLLPWRRLLP